MEVVFLGTHGWYPKHGHTPCIVVHAQNAELVFDLGTGAAMLQDELRLDREVHIFLSHLHLDHSVGLSFLLGVFKGKKLTIWGEKGVEASVRQLLSPPYFPMPVEKWPFGVEFREVGARQEVAGVLVETLPLDHSNPAIGYRVSAEGKVLAYLTDTRKCRNSVELAKGVDLLMHEATYSEKTIIGSGHSTGKAAGEVAREAGVKKLALFHIDAVADAKYASEILAEAKKEFKNSVLAKDGMRISV